MVKNIGLILLFLSSFAFAKINTIVSIAPQKSFVEAIGGEFVNVEVMVLPGSSPHSYEPKPSQMQAISKAQLYLTIGVEFEGAWLKKFSNQNKKMILVDSTKGIQKLMLKADEHHDDKASKKHERHNHTGFDPHVWTNTENIKIIAYNILETLITLDPEHKEQFMANYTAFIAKVDATNEQVKEVLKGVKKGSKFMVFHPSWGYFAHQYELEQLSIEIEGKEPKPKELALILKEAREENVKAIFAQPEFSDKSVKQIANELQIAVIKISPLASEWDSNIITLAKAIAHQY